MSKNSANLAHQHPNRDGGMVRKSWVTYGALLLVQVLFGVNYLAAKHVLRVFAPLTWGAVRMTAATLIFIVLMVTLTPSSRRRWDTAFLKQGFLFGLLSIALNQTFFLLGLHHTTPSHSALITTMTPMMTLLIAVGLKSEKLNSSKAWGIVLGVVGIVLLEFQTGLHFGSDTLKGDLLTLGNTVFFALFLALSRPYFGSNDLFWATGWTFIFGTLLQWGIAVPELVSHGLPGVWDWPWIPMAYSIFGATVLTYFLNGFALSRVSSSQVGFFIFAQPLVAMFSEWVVSGVVPGINQFVAAGFIFLGVSIGLKSWKPLKT